MRKLLPTSTISLTLSSVFVAALFISSSVVLFRISSMKFLTLESLDKFLASSPARGFIFIFWISDCNPN